MVMLLCVHTKIRPVLYLHCCSCRAGMAHLVHGRGKLLAGFFGIALSPLHNPRLPTLNLQERRTLVGGLKPLRHAERLRVHEHHAAVPE